MFKKYQFYTSVHVASDKRVVGSHSIPATARLYEIYLIIAVLHWLIPLGDLARASNRASRVVRLTLPWLWKMAGMEFPGMCGSLVPIQSQELYIKNYEAALF